MIHELANSQAHFFLVGNRFVSIHVLRKSFRKLSSIILFHHLHASSSYGYQLFLQLLFNARIFSSKKLLEVWIVFCLHADLLSLYLEMLVMTLSFIVLANYQYDQMNPLTVDIFTLTIALYLIVLLIAFALTFKAFQSSLQKQNTLLNEKEKNEIETITVKSNREVVLIPLNEITHIESLADYVKIYTHDSVAITKEKISKLQKELPTYFIRIHRSFIVNKNLIDSFSKEKIKINGTEMPISRTYKKEVMAMLEVKS